MPTRTYTPTVNPGDTRYRIWRNTNENQLNSRPTAYMHEHCVIRDAAGVEHVLAGTDATLSMVAPLTVEEQAEIVTLYNPFTEEVVGTATLGAIYMAIHSLGRHMQTKRDQAEQAP
jgi:hypothetical protein